MYLTSVRRLFMEYVIIVVLVLIVAFIYGLILRKKIYDEVDRLENWKLNITNRNVTEELSKVKNLNLSGETQERFEKWRSEWDDILSKHLPDLEEGLFDAEEHADRYRFKKAKAVLNNIEQSLQSIEASIERMFEELDTLLNSEENSRKHVEEIEPRLKELKKKLLQQRHLFEKAETYFEKEIEETQEKLTKYYELVEEGNYFEANEMVQKLQEELTTIEQRIESFPPLYKSCKKELPDQIDELISGVRDMREDGYRIDHYEYEAEALEYQERLNDYLNQLEKAEMEEAQHGIQEIEERIKEMYAQLEKEALARNYVEKYHPQLVEQLNVIKDEVAETKNEVNILQNSYHVEERDLELHLSLEKWINNLTKQLDDIKLNLEDEETSHVTIRAQLETLTTQLDELVDQHEQFKERLHTLRKGERDAKQQLSQMKQELLAVYRKLQKSNIPGVPHYIEDVLEKSRSSLLNVQRQVEAQQLDMTKVQSAMEDAVKDTENAKQQTEDLLETAYMAESVIQYGNRYRSKYPLLAAKLSEAEQAFRSYQYDVALEEASHALEEVEPGAIKRIQDMVQTPVG